MYWALGAALTSGILIYQGAPDHVAALAGGSYAFLTVNAAIDLRTAKLIPLWTHCAAALCLIAYGALLAYGHYAQVIIGIGLSLLLSALMAIVSRASPAALGAGDARLIGVLTAWVALRDPAYLVGMLIIAGSAQLCFFLLFRLCRSMCISKSAPERWQREEHSKISGSVEAIGSAPPSDTPDIPVTLPFAPSLVLGSWCALMLAPASIF